MIAFVRSRFSRWLASRLPPSDSLTLTQRNIYILPTRAGFMFALTLVVMLLAAINYQLNLGFALTFLLAGAGLVSMHMTHGNLRGLTLHLRPPAPVFAGHGAMLEIVVTNPRRLRLGLGLRVQDTPAGSPDGTVWIDVPANGQETLRLSIVPPTRGRHGVPLLRIESVFPFGLFRAWSVWRPAAQVLAWPLPEDPAPPLPTTNAQAGENAIARRGSGSELDGVRPWRRGDTMRQVVWKKVARSGELVSRETTAVGQRELWLEYSSTAAPGIEQRLSRLAAWVLAAEAQGVASGLKLPGQTLAPNQGDAHKRAALDLLGEFA